VNGVWLVLPCCLVVPFDYVPVVVCRLICGSLLLLVGSDVPVRAVGVATLRCRLHFAGHVTTLNVSRLMVTAAFGLLFRVTLLVVAVDWFCSSRCSLLFRLLRFITLFYGCWCVVVRCYVCWLLR